jgi:rhodanese-related sulfurtransferase
VEKGYTDVRVYREGILGWAKAGLPLVSNESYPPAEISLVASKDLRQMPKNSLVLVDIRPRSHFEKGHVPGSVNIDLEVLHENLALLPKEKTLVLIDHKGKLTLTTGRYLYSRGFGKVMRLDGGFNAWVKNGFSFDTALRP